MERRAGFTLIEILVVLSLLAVLMGLSAGLIQRAGQGNLLLQTTQSLASQLASARAQSYGNDRAYVLVEPRMVRTYRNRPVFHWPCEDFVKTTDSYELQYAGGGVAICEPSDGTCPVTVGGVASGLITNASMHTFLSLPPRSSSKSVN